MKDKCRKINIEMSSENLWKYHENLEINRISKKISKSLTKISIEIMNEKKKSSEEKSAKIVNGIRNQKKYGENE